MAAAPVIIEAAINGVATKEQNPHVPRSPDEIARDALACFEAGAAIVHNHVDAVGVDGQRSAARYIEGWQPVLDKRPDALLYPTVNFGSSVEESYSHLEPLVAQSGLRIGLSDPGSVNLGPIVYANSASDIDHQLGLCQRLQLGPSLAIFEPGFLRAALGRWRDGRLPAGAMVKFYFCGDVGYLGGHFGLPPTPTSLDAYLAMMEGCDLPWSVAVFGGDVVESGIAGLALERGGHLHVGLEDYGGPRQPTNEELVNEAVALAGEVGRPVASCDEAASILALPRR
jgi:3-keto-5-aminohexanoate cleavage enzyme